jgi:DNA polymerase (family 10)
MAEAARDRGYAYLAVTDHSKRLTVANGLDEDRLRKQMEEIDELNRELEDILVFKGIECDILEDGALDLSDEVLGELDLVIGSVHSLFNLSREKQTERVLRAMDHPHFSFLAHPTGRLLLSRDGYELDLERVIAHAAERGCFLEINANPMRLDLNDVYARMARDAGVLITINTDSHRVEGFLDAAWGIGQARRAWLRKEDVVNTRGVDEVRKLLRGTMG